MSGARVVAVLRAVAAAWVLALSTMAPGVALAGELASQGVTVGGVTAGTGDCK